MNPKKPRVREKNPLRFPDTEFKVEGAMADKVVCWVEVSTCEKCGNEAEMSICLQLSQVQTPYGEIWKKQKETRTCQVCGNEAEMIIDFGD